MKVLINIISLLVIIFGGILTYVAVANYCYYYHTMFNGRHNFVSNSMIVFDYKAAWCGVTLIIAGLITLTINDIFKKL